ncbi:hypothetical protein B0H11DRAFT_2239547 [Mycena galericulata]|nr:hypothetical protein B0H11DRAFT_2239547 [Mycena galericulata]
MKQLAAHNFEDILQCVIPCVEGLLAEDEDNEILLDLLYDVATIQAFAKMRVHVDFML